MPRVIKHSNRLLKIPTHSNLPALQRKLARQAFGRLGNTHYEIELILPGNVTREQALELAGRWRVAGWWAGVFHENQELIFRLRSRIDTIPY